MESLMKYTLSGTGQLLVERLRKQIKEHGKLVIAFDFDDTVYPYTYPIEVLVPVQEALMEAKRQGHILVCYTANTNLDKVSAFLESNGLTPGYYNESPVASKGKIYYNIFLDDKCGLQETLEILNIILEENR